MSEHVNAVWTTEQSSMLAALLAEGFSFAESAVKLNDHFKTNYSRNALCGKAFRLNIKVPKAKSAPKPRKPRAPRPQANKTIRIVRANANSDKMRYLESPQSAEVLALRCAEVVPLHQSLIDLEHNGCRYPYGDGPITFCGHPQIKDSSYCGPHWALTFSESRRTNDAAAENRRRNLRKQFKMSLMESA